MIRRRLVFNFYGFEPSDSDHLIGRLLYCANKTADLWGFELMHDHPRSDSESLSAQCKIKATHKDWQVDTKIVQFGFGDIISAYFAGFFPLTLIKHIFNYLALVLSPLPVRYFKASKLYGTFFLFPLVLMAVFWGAAYGLALLIGQVLQVGGISLSSTLFYLTVLVLFFVLCRWPGQKMHLLLSLAHWSYAKDLALQTNPEIEARYGAVAELMIDEISLADYDEIIISGHSFGSTWALMAMSEALLKKPDLFDDKNVAFLRLGSSLMNTSLFRVPSFIIEHIQNLATNSHLFWHEFQTKDDPVSFYKADFIKHLGLTEPSGGYVISRVNFKHSMERARYRKIKRSFYHVHRQYGLYHDKRVSFDYLIRLLGPISSKQLAKQPQKFAHIHGDVRLF